MLSESKYLVDLWVGFFGKKPHTLMIPIYSTTILYDNKVTFKCVHNSNVSTAIHNDLGFRLEVIV